MTRIGEILGTPSYMAPEQANGDPDAHPTADVYSLGVILYELLTGKPPFTGESAWATLLMVGYTLPDPPSRARSGVAADLDAMCLKCLRQDPQERYATAKDLADDLERFQRGRPVRARPVTLRRRFAGWARRSAAQLGLAMGILLGLATILAAGAFVGVLWQRNRLPAPTEPVEAPNVPERKAADRLRDETGKNATDDAQERSAVSSEAERFDAREAIKDAESERDAARRAQAEAEKQRREAGNRFDRSPARTLCSSCWMWPPSGKRDPGRARQTLQDPTLPARSARFHLGTAGILLRSAALTFPVQTKNVLAVAVAADGRIVSAGADGTVRLLDQAGTERKILTEHKGQVFALKFAPDGEHFATGGFDTQVLVEQVRQAAAHWQVIKARFTRSLTRQMGKRWLRQTPKERSASGKPVREKKRIRFRRTRAVFNPLSLVPTANHYIGWRRFGHQKLELERQKDAAVRPSARAYRANLFDCFFAGRKKTDVGRQRWLSRGYGIMGKTVVRP